MSTALSLGSDPLGLAVNLSDGDYNQQLQRMDAAAWDPSTVITLEFSDGTVWTAEIDGDLATWHATRSEVARVIAAGRAQSVTLRYVDSTPTNVVWAVGNIQVKINA